jgi:hypothetical protein
MKRTLYASAFALLIVMSGVAAAQDLGAIARQQRQQKKSSAKKVYTNDDISSGQPVMQSAEPATEAKVGAAGEAKAGAVVEAKVAKPKEASVEDKTKAAAALQQTVDAQKAEIASLTRELDIADRENRLRAANYYGDAGNSLRDPAKWAAEQIAKQEEIDGKKKAIDAAKAKLADIIEQGRKAGIKVNE